MVPRAGAQYISYLHMQIRLLVPVLAHVTTPRLQTARAGGCRRDGADLSIWWARRHSDTRTRARLSVQLS